jgi:hypothetical protein
LPIFEWLLIAHPARSAYACFLVFSARTGLIGKGSNGSTPTIRQRVEGFEMVETGRSGGPNLGKVSEGAESGRSFVPV